MICVKNLVGVCDKTVGSNLTARVMSHGIVPIYVVWIGCSGNMIPTIFMVGLATQAFKTNN